MNRKELEALYLKVAAHLAGRECKIYFETPEGGWSGSASVGMDGIPVIQVTPDLCDLESEYKTLLHEVAHVRLHHKIYQRSTRKVGRGETPTPEQKAAHEVKPRENEADKLVQHWIEFAENNAYKYSPGGNHWLERHLNTLLHWQPTIENKIITPPEKGQ